MKIAIIGAGVSGFSCAYELARNGIVPVIFEKKSYIGDVMEYACIWPGQITFPAEDPLEDPLLFLKESFSMEIVPAENLNEIVIISPRKKMKVRGNLGYIFKRGKEIYSLENQLACKSKVPVLFDTFADMNEMRGSFDRIIVATGNNSIAKQLHVWTDTFVAQARVATALGDFDTSSVNMWLNTEYSKNAFCYLIPNNPKEASLVMIVNGITHHELDYYWQRFLKIERIRYQIIEIRDTQHTCGFVRPLEKDRVYFIGNTGGFTDDLIGVGAFNAILSGIYAAKAILENKSYDDLCKPLYREVIRLHEYRKAMNTMENEEFDALVSLMGAPVIKQYLYNNPSFKLSHKAFAAKLHRSLKK